MRAPYPAQRASGQCAWPPEACGISRDAPARWPESERQRKRGSERWPGKGQETRRQQRNYYLEHREIKKRRKKKKINVQLELKVQQVALALNL